MKFSDSLNENVTTVQELLASMPVGSRQSAKRAAMAMEKTFNDIRKDSPRDPAVALGTAFAVFMLAQLMVENEKANDGKGLIQLLS